MPKKNLTSLSSKDVSVAPSILAADFTKLGDEIRAVDAAGAEVLHVDIMDGHFVPNLSIGPPVVKGIRSVTELPFDVHLMLDNPEKYVDAFTDAGADHLTIHVEIDGDVAAILDAIRRHGCSTGLSLRPDTPAETLKPFMDQIDLILVMTVEPGFGGQSFREYVVPKIREIRDMIRNSGRQIHLEVDGGIDATTAPIVVSAGANLLVAGTSVFRAKEGIPAAIRNLRG